MAFTQSPFCNPMIFGLALESDLESTTKANIRGGATTLRTILVVSPAGDDAHVKLYDATSVTAGTTAPDWILPIRAATTREIIFGSAETVAGLPFTNGLSARCVTEAGTGGTTNTTQAVAVSFNTVD